MDSRSSNSHIGAVLVLGFAALLSLPQWSRGATDPCDGSGVPAEVRELLASRYPDWKIESAQDLDSDDRSSWLSSTPARCPGITVGHFESARDLSYAFLLLSKRSIKLGFKLVVISRQPNAGYRVRLVESESTPNASGGSDTVISAKRPGEFSEPEGGLRVRVKLDAIEVQTLEKGRALYYWRNGKYHQLITSE